jgi:RNA 2',3'-cyclic 3'-phosphodiesterase
MPDTRRLFFALWPMPEQRNQLAAHMAAMVPIPCRPMAPDNLHVTLAFLSSVSAASVSDLLELGSRVNFVGCDITFDRLAIWKQARVLVLTASHLPGELQQLADELQAHLKAARFHTDDRPFRPHVTLARDVRVQASDTATTPFLWTVQNFVLVESISTTQGVRYQVLTTFTT